jgi:hypothetical protein
VAVVGGQRARPHEREAYSRLQRYLEAAGLPRAGCTSFGTRPRSSVATPARAAEPVSAFLDHSSLQVTSVYLRRLEGGRGRGLE